MRRFQLPGQFKLVYWIIAIATAQHTAWGAATTMQGAQREGDMGWWLQGLAFAIAIDISMVMVATKIRNGAHSTQSVGVWRLRIPINWYTVTFATVAIVSFYFQLLYAWSHAQPLPEMGGIAQEWITRLQPLIDARIVIAPAALPLIAILYTIGGLGKGGEAQPKRNPAAQSRNQIAISQPPVAPHVDIAVDQLQSGAQPKALPAPMKLRDDAGLLTGYVCPGCQKQLSISGWSRHKTSCDAYVRLTTNGHGGE